MHTSKTLKTRNKHRGSSFEDFLKQEGLLENVQAAAFKRALAKVNDMMKAKRLNKSAMAARMRTSRAAVHRLLDRKNTSVTLATLNRAARSLGCKVKIEFVPAQGSRGMLLRLTRKTHHMRHTFDTSTITYDRK